MIPCRISDWDNSNSGYEKVSEPPQKQGEDDYDYYDRLEAWKDNTRKIVQPEPADFSTPAERLKTHYGYEVNTSDLEPCVDLRKDFGKLQIIVKLANIHLTPEKPTYEGGTWHVEGQANESMQVCL